jgi:hypothetical protein
MRVTIAALACCVLPAFGHMSEEMRRKFDEPEKHIVRLPPTAFPNLPQNVVRELARRGCSIPQVAEIKKPTNVIRGSFANAVRRTGRCCAL